MRLNRRRRYYLRQFWRKAKIFIVIFIIMGGLYVTYDHFFRLPISVPPAGGGTFAEEKLGFERFNILLLGLDGREDLNDRSDTIILFSLDEKKKKAQMLSIPRDSRVQVRGKLDKINAAYAYGGVDLSLKTVSDFLGVQIDRYVVVDFPGLIKLADSVGGIDVYVPTRMYTPLEGIDLQPGSQHLNGQQILAYTRFRDAKYGDVDRARRQQEVLRLLVTKIVRDKNISQIIDFIGFAMEEVETDLSTREMIALARLASPVLENGVAMKILPGEGVRIGEVWYYEADLTNLAEILKITSEKS